MPNDDFIAQLLGGLRKPLRQFTARSNTALATMAQGAKGARDIARSITQGAQAVETAMGGAREMIAAVERVAGSPAEDPRVGVRPQVAPPPAAPRPQARRPARASQEIVDAEIVEEAPRGRRKA